MLNDTNTADTNDNNTLLSVDEVNEILESRDIDMAKFWALAAGGDRTPILAEDIERIIDAIEA